jgi:hypothetical protein
MKIALLLLGLTLLQGSGPHGQQIDSEDHAGPVVIKTVDKDREKKNGEIRSFVWRHWYQRRRGLLVEKTYSKEGVPATTTFILEPDQQGVWTLRVKTQWPPSKGSNPEHDRTEYRVYSVRRIRRHQDAQSSTAFIPDEELQSGESYRLLFYDDKGNDVGGI